MGAAALVTGGAVGTGTFSGVCEREKPGDAGCGATDGAITGGVGERGGATDPDVGAGLGDDVPIAAVAGVDGVADAQAPERAGVGTDARAEVPPAPEATGDAAAPTKSSSMTPDAPIVITPPQTEHRALIPA